MGNLQNPVLKAALSSNTADHFISDEKTTLSMLCHLCWVKNTIIPKEADQLMELFSKRTSMCGIGTKRVKYFLDRKVKEGDLEAELLYTALKMEDKRISSLLCSFKYRGKNLYGVKRLLDDLLFIIDIYKVGDYGYLDLLYSDYNITGSELARGLCIDLPGDEQLGYAVSDWDDNKPFKGVLRNTHKTNLAKLEDAINRLYGDQIVEKYGSPATAIDVKLPNVIIKKAERSDEVYVLEPKGWFVAACQRNLQRGI